MLLVVAAELLSEQGALSYYFRFLEKGELFVTVYLDLGSSLRDPLLLNFQPF